MKLHQCQSNIIALILWCAVVHLAFAEPPPKHPRPLVFKSWPPTRSQPFRNAGMHLQLRGSGSSNIMSRLPSSPNMFAKAANPMQFVFPSRINRPVSAAGLQSSPSTRIFFKTGPPPNNGLLKKPYAAALTSPGVFKFSSPSHKTAIKFKSPPPVPLKSKPDFIYEKVNVPKFAEPVIGTEAAIHQIAAPNLSLNQLDSDLTKVSVQAFALEQPISHHHPYQHNTHYQVREHTNDLTIKNSLTGQKSFFAPDNDPNYHTHPLPLSNDPLNSPSDGKLKPSDVLYHQTIEFNASPLVQQHFAVDPFTFPVTAQPQLQQYHLQQNAMVQQGMPLAAYNPTYLVMQSNNLLGQHQQHLTPQLFSPAQGYIDTSSGGHGQTYVTPAYGKNYEVASLGQIYSAQQDVHHQLQNIPTSTYAPSTIGGSYQDVQASQNIQTITQLEPKPNNYLYSQNFIDLPDEKLNTNDIHNMLNYEDYYQRQLENDLILREAHDKLQEKIHKQKQQEQNAFDLHQLALAEKFNPLRIVVPDEEQFKKRIDDSSSYEDVYDDDIDETTTEKPATQTF